MWAVDLIEEALTGPTAAWFRPQQVRAEWARFVEGRSDNSFYVWQWISLALMRRLRVTGTLA
jgi:asparagine synthase (glutamine-hydrolysing)